MTNRQRAMAILNYRQFDKLPIVHFGSRHFGYWQNTLAKWVNQGHITTEDTIFNADSSVCKISQKLGFDFDWFNVFPWSGLLSPAFDSRVIKENPDGSKQVLNSDGVIVLQKNNIISIPAEIDHSLKDKKSWEQLYKPKLQFNEKNIKKLKVNTGNKFLPFDSGGLKFLENENRQNPIGLMIGSLIGRIRDFLGLVGLSYMMFDNQKLLDEIIETVADLCYKQTEYVLTAGAKFDFAHYWEDICFKNGPLIPPQWFNDKIGPHYKRISKLTSSYGIDIVSVDCDGVIDALIPTWLDNGVNTMFPMEIGTWHTSIKTWRNKHGRELRGAGGVDKKVFAYDYKAVDAEIERLKPLVELGGYIPCPDHAIPTDAKWENIQYYCDKMRETFS